MKYHFIAIGGTGMGALAGLLKSAGHEVRGSDKQVYPPMSDQLDALQVPVIKGFSAENLEWAPEAVIVGNTCVKDNVEVVEAQRLGLPLLSMAQVLAERFLAEKHSIVVAGTHGKTTTSSLLAQLLMISGRDPGFFIGGVPLDFGQGWRYGSGSEFIVEGDEYDTAFFDKKSKFLHYQPRTAVLTAVELDHVDVFSSMEAVRETFRKFVRSIPEDGLLIVCAQNREALVIADVEARCRVETYGVMPAGFSGDTAEFEAARPLTWLARSLEDTKHGRCKFEVRRNGELYDRFESLMVGEHNVGNALAAIAVAHSLDVPLADIKRGLHEFAGIKRRQEIRGLAQGVYVLDDYAHHPTAVSQTLQALRRRFKGRRLLAAYEPRTATSRRKTFQREFVDAFKHADLVVIGRLFDPSKIPQDERFDPERLALELHQCGTKASYIEDTDAVVQYLVADARPGDVVVLLSSGSFDGLHEKLLAALGDPVTPALRQDMPQIRELLERVDLAANDFSDDDTGNFLVLRNETGFVGCVGLEVYGEDAILRSLAIKKKARSTGYGWMLADTVIAHARLRGVHRVYLLTDTASDFFAAKFGFRVVLPSTLSQAIAESPTFRAAPEGGVAMRLDL